VTYRLEVINEKEGEGKKSPMLNKRREVTALMILEKQRGGKAKASIWRKNTTMTEMVRKRNGITGGDYAVTL